MSVVTAEWLNVIFLSIAITATLFAIRVSRQTSKECARTRAQNVETRAQNVETWTDCVRINRARADDWRRLGYPDRAREYDHLADRWEQLVNDTKEDA